MPTMPWFPDPGSYIRYLDKNTKQLKYRQLTWRRAPLTYPRRIASVAAGAKDSGTSFDELNPSDEKKHIYLVYIGVNPGVLCYIYHPVDIKTLKWDETLEDVNDNLQACIDYERSPYHHPTYTIGIERDRYPAFQFQNISGSAINPEIVIIAAQYKVREHSDLTQEELDSLNSGRTRSYPWDFGGEM